MLGAASPQGLAPGGYVGWAWEEKSGGPIPGLGASPVSSALPARLPRWGT